MIGLYGPIFFHSGSTGLTTFDAMKKTVTARWGEHAVHLDKPLLEYTGPQLIEISFRMELVKPFTMDPLAAIVTLEEIMDLAIPLPLVIGMKPMGRGLSMFVLVSLSHEMKYFYRGGGLLGASVEVQLKEYPMSLANILNTMKQALGGMFGGGAGTPGTGAAGAVGTDANAGTYPTITNDEAVAYQANTYPTIASDQGSVLTNPQIAQNAGNPVSANLQSGIQPEAPPQPPSIPEANLSLSASKGGGD